jgi:hypothetical protein
VYLQLEASNPFLKSMLDANPAMRSMMQNPAFMQQMLNPAALEVPPIDVILSGFVLLLTFAVNVRAKVASVMLLATAVCDGVDGWRRSAGLCQHHANRARGT